MPAKGKRKSKSKSESKSGRVRAASTGAPTLSNASRSAPSSPSSSDMANHNTRAPPDTQATGRAPAQDAAQALASTTAEAGAHSPENSSSGPPTSGTFGNPTVRVIVPHSLLLAAQAAAQTSSNSASPNPGQIVDFHGEPSVAISMTYEELFGSPAVPYVPSQPGLLKKVLGYEESSDSEWT